MSKTFKFCLASACVLSLSLMPYAKAAEYYSPMQPGASTGVPAGALPPPGLYAHFDTYFQTGQLKNGNGKNVAGVKLNGANITSQLLYVPGWRFLGANYAMRLTIPFNLNTIKTSGGSGPNSITGYGMFNPIITPEMLSWNLGGGNFLGEGFSVYLPIGDFRHEANSAGEQVETQDSIANHYWTFEPNIAYSYLGGGWDFTVNNTFDFNTKNTITNYQTGDIYYLDYTITRSLGPVGFGVVGNYIQQFTPDKQNGIKVADVGGTGGYGHEYMHASVGPLFSYNIGKSTITLRYLYGFAGKNGGNPSFLHLGINFPIQ